MTVSGFYVSHFRFTLMPREAIRLPRMNKAITLRGAFGTSFRSLVCVDRKAECDRCMVRPTCPYGFIFAPQVPPDAERLRLNRDIPRPFVIKPPLDSKEVYPAGDPLAFDMVLVGRAREFLPYFLVSFRELGERGIGVSRGRFEIASVDALDARGQTEKVMEAGDPMVRVSGCRIGFDDTPLLNARRIEVRFLTPMLIKHEGKWVKPTFGPLMRRIRDRVQALSCFYCGEAMDMDFRAYGDSADTVASMDEDFHWVEESRYSKHRDLKHDLKGYVGSVTFEGELGTFLPLLWMGQHVHVGKAAAFGQGWYRLEES